MRAVTVTDVIVGRLVKAFGIRGEVKFNPTDDFWEEVLSSKRLVYRRETADGVKEGPFSLKHFRPHKNCYVFTFDGVQDRNTAEALVGADIFVDIDTIDVDLPEQRRPFQVVGMTVKNEDGEVLGTVSSIIFSPAHDVYEVTGDSGDFMVPAISEFVISIDEDSKEIVIRPIPGLIDG
jgi:16S rRNA processing protein RimM